MSNEASPQADELASAALSSEYLTRISILGILPGTDLWLFRDRLRSRIWVCVGFRRAVRRRIL